MITIDIKKVDDAMIGKSSTILMKRNSQMIIDIAFNKDTASHDILKSKFQAVEIIGRDNIDQVIIEPFRLFLYLKRTAMTFENYELYHDHDSGLAMENGRVVNPIADPLPPGGSKVVPTMRDVMHSMMPDDPEYTPFIDPLPGDVGVKVHGFREMIEMATYPVVKPKKETEIHNNSHAFRDFLDSKGIEYRPNGHFTTVIGDVDFFELGCQYGELKRQDMIDREKRNSHGEKS